MLREHITVSKDIANLFKSGKSYTFQEECLETGKVYTYVGRIAYYRRTNITGTVTVFFKH
jgi:hypothetical protein